MLKETAVAQRCPKCGLINPESAQQCDCGYDLVLRRPGTISKVAGSAKVAGRSPFPLMVEEALAKLSNTQQNAFQEEYWRRRKSENAAALLWLLLGWHYAYLRKWGLQILFWLTGGGLIVWWVVDLFRVRGLVRDYNRDVALDVMRNLRALQ